MYLDEVIKRHGYEFEVEELEDKIHQLEKENELLKQQLADIKE